MEELFFFSPPAGVGGQIDEAVCVCPPAGGSLPLAAALGRHLRARHVGSVVRIPCHVCGCIVVSGSARAQLYPPADRHFGDTHVSGRHVASHGRSNYMVRF